MKNSLRSQELPSIQRSLSLHSQSTPGIKFNTSTIRNPELSLLKLPSLSLIKQSSNEVADRNTKNKLFKL